MENITVFSNRLDESNETVENVLKMKATAKKMPWFLRFAPKAKGLVSFVQNLLSPLTQKEGVRGGQLSAFFQLAAAVVVGIGLLLAPLSVLSNGFDGDEPDDPPPPAPAPPPNNAPEVSCLWVSNHGSAGFSVEFDVSAPSGGTIPFERFLLTGPNTWDADSAYVSGNQDWLSIPGFDGGPPLPYPGYNQYVPAFSFNIAGQVQLTEEFGSIDNPFFITYWSTRASVDISLYVIVDSNGALYSMLAWAYDSDGDGYEVPVYYSAGGGADGTFITLP